MEHKELKQRLLTDGTYKKFNDLQRAYFKFCYNGDYSPSELSFFDNEGEVLPFDDFITKNSDFEPNTLIALRQLSNAYSFQRRKLNEHISYLFERKDLELYFLTFTFKSSTLKRNPTYRRNIITRLLCSIPYVADYIGNIDYGKSTSREHYHYIAAFDSFEFNGNFINEKGHLKLKELEPYLRYGNYDLKPIRRNLIDYKKVSSYIAKLTNHALKVKQGSLITKRDSDFQRWKKDHDYLLKHKKLTHEVVPTLLTDTDRYREKPNETRFKEELAKNGYDELCIDFYSGILKKPLV